MLERKRRAALSFEVYRGGWGATAQQLQRHASFYESISSEKYGKSESDLPLSGMPTTHLIVNKKFLQEKAVEAIKQKEEKRKKSKPEEQEGMPQHQHCPREKRRGDRNPECHEEQQKVVA
jgi:hypothetical protein